MVGGGAPSEPDLGDERERRRPKARRVVATAAGSTSVTIRDFAFSAKSVTIDAGDTVTWTNQDDVEHYSGGVRVTRFDETGIEEIGRFIDQGGNDLWGAQLTESS